MPQISMPDEIVEAINEIIKYNWNDERKHFEEHHNVEMVGDDKFVDVDSGAEVDISDSDHIFKQIKLVNDFFENLEEKKPEKSPKHRILDWIHSWGHGGGCASLEYWIGDILEEVSDDASFDDIKDKLQENSPGYVCCDYTIKGLDSSYEQFIDEMVNDAQKKQEEHILENLVCKKCGKIMRHIDILNNKCPYCETKLEEK